MEDEGEKGREGKTARRIVAAARLLQHLRKVHPVVRRREESRDSAGFFHTDTSSFVVGAMRTNETGLKPAVYLFIGYNCLLSSD